jgi:hypothetical protein
MLDCHYDYDWHFLGGKFQKLAIILSFSTTQNVYLRLSYLCTTALILFIHVNKDFWNTYLSFKQFKLK